MKTFVVYEVWTRSRVVAALSEDDALERHSPAPAAGDLSLANWYAVEVPLASGGDGRLRAVPRTADAVDPHVTK